MGAKEFDDYYGALYDSRWNTLKAALLKPVRPCQYHAGGGSPYMMDYASILAARSLRCPSRGLILDACAAPGGKSLVLASESPVAVKILSNEPSRERQRRLRSVLDEYLDVEKRSKVTISGFDAAALAAKKTQHERFHGILLDTPCSCERHVLSNEKYLSKWTPSRPRFLAKRQWALLSAAILLLTRGGCLVYATCALSTEENDCVAVRLIKKYGDIVELDRPDFLEGEETEYGRIILPDADSGLGPMYVARFRKRSQLRDL
jgi:16S rRNA (cytosine1407-C5)-methyltransferase